MVLTLPPAPQSHPKSTSYPCLGFLVSVYSSLSDPLLLLLLLLRFVLFCFLVFCHLLLSSLPLLGKDPPGVTPNSSHF